MAQVTKRFEQEPEAFRTRIHNTDTCPEYRKLAIDYLRSNFSTDDLAQILDTQASLKELGSNLFKKCDADILAKCPEVFKSIEDVRRWRRTRHSSLTLKSFISRLGVLSSDFRQTLSPHSASEHDQGWIRLRVLLNSGSRQTEMVPSQTSHRMARIAIIMIWASSTYLRDTIPALVQRGIYCCRCTRLQTQQQKILTLSTMASTAPTKLLVGNARSGGGLQGRWRRTPPRPPEQEVRCQISSF